MATQLTEINLVVADLDRSHSFYTALGWEMRHHVPG